MKTKRSSYNSKRFRTRMLTLLLATTLLVLSSSKTLAGDLPQALKPSPYSCLARPEVDKINTCFDDLRDCHATVKKGSTGVPIVAVIILAIVAAGAGYAIGSSH